MVDREIERNGHARQAVAHQLTAFAPDALHLAVQGIRHGVQQRGLARTGRAGNGEHFEVAEIELLLVAEAGEALDFQAERAHQCISCSSSKTSVNAVTSEGSGSAPWNVR